MSCPFQGPQAGPRPDLRLRDAQPLDRRCAGGAERRRTGQRVHRPPGRGRHREPCPARRGASRRTPRAGRSTGCRPWTATSCGMATFEVLFVDEVPVRGLRVRGPATWSATSPPTSRRRSSTEFSATSSATGSRWSGECANPAGWGRDLRRRAGSGPSSAGASSRLGRAYAVARTTSTVLRRAARRRPARLHRVRRRSTGSRSSPRWPDRRPGRGASCSPIDPDGRPRAWMSVHDRAAGRTMVMLYVDRSVEEAAEVAGALYAWAEEQAREICTPARGARRPGWTPARSPRTRSSSDGWRTPATPSAAPGRR